MTENSVESSTENGSLEIDNIFINSKDLESVSANATVFESVKVKDEFNEQFGLQLIDATAKDNNINRTVSLFISNIGNEYLGHLIFNFPNQSEIANADINRLKTETFKPIVEQLPENLRAYIKKSDTFNALEVDENQRGKGLADILWLFGAAYLKKQGVKQIEVSGDVTIEKKDKVDSFYKHLGCEVTPDGKEVYNMDNLHNSVDKIKSYL